MDLTAAGTQAAVSTQSEDISEGDSAIAMNRESKSSNVAFVLTSWEFSYN